ncbi:TnsD family Tn7-like transposition protein [Metabacillus bambusae]|uniref:TnsD family transposase n=1 Tax=Metabacillus bambusae TaxID=2795218 RepID=A0ABS3N5W0_9BACI|nr:TnsD family Tn7-like transposition protein [Metabacillus bambusae]MBO1513553.1 TnsD family transposase [Metabacillus bambusae]
MITFFPTPYPEGELLYSILARYHVRSGNISPKATVEELFGSRSVTAVLDLPANVDRLISNLPIGSNYTAERLIVKNTLYPFYSAFLPPERTKITLQSMKGNSGGGIHSRTGIMASTIKENRYLRVCKECSMESLKIYGEIYWKRIDQVPGIIICPKHKVLLSDSKVLVHHDNKHEFISATIDNCNLSDEYTNLTSIEEVIESEFIPKYIQLVDNVGKLLNNRYPNKPPEWFFSQYIERLKMMGLANTNGSVRQKELRGQFIEFYGESLLEIVQSPINDNDSSWLSMMVRKPRKTVHPIRHLLMIQFLGITLEELWSVENDYLPFGKAPFLCLNAGADHYLKPVVTNMTIRYDNKIKRPVGTFSCSCGFVYARSGPDSSEEYRYKVGRVKEFGQIWEAKLKELLQKDLSLREIARRLKVDVNTVKKYGQKLREGEVELSSEGQNDVINKEGFREEWLDLQKKYPEKSKTELRKDNSRTYAWLYRNDREWLNTNSPKKRQIPTVNNRVDWDKRDEEILKVVKAVVEEILNSDDKPERITISRVGKKIGKLSLLEKHLSKLPQTNEYLLQNTDSVRDFQIRRIKWAIGECERQGCDLQWWRVAKIACIRGEWKEELQEEFENICSRIF